MIVLPPSLEDNATVLLATAGTLVAGLLYLYTTARNRGPAGVKLRKIHRPRDTLPLLGNAVSFYRNRHDIRAWLVEQSLEFKGEPWKRKIPGQPDIIMFSWPEAMEEISTTQFEKFEKGSFQIDIISTLFGRGVVASDGERWVHQRKAGVKFFSARSLRTLMHTSLHKNLEQLCDVLDVGQRAGELVDLRRLFQELTLQTFVEMGLGVELNWIGSKEPHEFQKSLDEVSRLVIFRFRQPMWYWKLLRWLNIGDEATITYHSAIVLKWLQKVIAQGLGATVNHQQKKTPHDGAVEDYRKSILELFVEHSHESKDGLRAEDLADFLLTFVVGARDTTSATLAWFFYAIGKHAHVEQRIRDELQHHFPELVGRRDVLLSTDQIKQLTYLEAAIRETLRLYPAAPLTAKFVLEDTIVCGDIPLRKGQLCVLDVYAMARNPDVWGEDAAQFKPERWVDSTNGGQLRQFPASKFFTFGAGPRACIGMSLAYLELRSVSANLLSRYRFELDAANDGSSPPGLNLLMRHPLLARVTATAK